MFTFWTLFKVGPVSRTIRIETSGSYVTKPLKSLACYYYLSEVKTTTWEKTEQMKFLTASWHINQKPFDSRYTKSPLILILFPRLDYPKAFEFIEPPVARRKYGINFIGRTRNPCAFPDFRLPAYYT
jgi:hypothetical protein